MGWLIGLAVLALLIWAGSKSAGTEQNAALSALGKMHKAMFPKGQEDTDAGAREVQRILGGDVPFDEARNIFVKSYALWSIRGDLDKDRLILHLKGYCWEYFDDEKVDGLMTYLAMVKLAAAMGGSPAEVKRTPEGGYEF